MDRNYFKFVMVIVFMIIQFQSYPQIKLDDVTLTRIPQKKIRNFIEGRIRVGKHDFEQIRPSWNKGDDFSFFRKKEMTFHLEGKLTQIWQSYTTANPTLAWNSRRLSFGLLLLKFPENIYYRDDSIGGIDTGQVFFLNLKLLLGIVNLPVAFEVITVDSEKKIIEFSYIEDNKSHGFQQIKFLEEENGYVKITHVSYFRSNSIFRDRWLYPFFHGKIIDDFHRNMKCIVFKNKYL